MALKELKFSSDKVIKIVKTWLSCLKRCEANIDKTKDELKELIVKRPHLVMMVLDDVGGADVGYHGSNFPTPNIDRLATHEDIRLENTGTDDGTISEVKQFYTQNGKTMQHPHYTINGKKHLSDVMCADWVAYTKEGTAPIVAITKKIAIQVCATRTDATSSFTALMSVTSMKLVPISRSTVQCLSR